LFQTASFLRFLLVESVNFICEAAASALNALDARALVNGVRVLGQTGQMSRLICAQRKLSWMHCQLPWTRGKMISVTSLTVIAVAWPPGVNFTLAPQAPFPIATATLSPVAGVSKANVCAGTINMPANTPLGTWSFELQKQGAADFRSLTKNDVGDLLLLVNYNVS
jgi:hypothetical protein